MHSTVCKFQASLAKVTHICEKKIMNIRVTNLKVTSFTNLDCRSNYSPDCN